MPRPQFMNSTHHLPRKGIVSLIVRASGIVGAEAGVTHDEVVRDVLARRASWRPWRWWRPWPRSARAAARRSDERDPLGGWQQRLGAGRVGAAAPAGGRRRGARRGVPRSRDAPRRGDGVAGGVRARPGRRSRRGWRPPEPMATVEDLAAEVGRLRAAFSRIAAALRNGGDTGAFYLGRMDVAVTAEATVSATTEMTPAGASVIEARDLQANDKPALAGALALAPGVSFTRIGQRNETARLRPRLRHAPGAAVRGRHPGLHAVRRLRGPRAVHHLRRGRTAGQQGLLLGPLRPQRARRHHQHRVPPARRRGWRAWPGVSYGSGSAATTYVNAGTRLKQVVPAGRRLLPGRRHLPARGRLRRPSRTSPPATASTPTSATRSST